MRLYNQKENKVLRRKLRKDLTPEERKIWQLIRNRQVLGLKFFRQYSVGQYIMDFYCPLMKLCLEIDGGQHNDKLAKNNDEIRTQYLESVGIKIERFWNNEVNEDIEAVGEKIYQICSQLLINSPRPSLF